MTKAMVDIDGCLINFDECFRTSAEEVLQRKMQVDRAYEWSLAKSYGLTDEEVQHIFNSDHILQKLETFTPLQKMAEYVLFLYDSGYEIIYVTARGTSRRPGVVEFNNNVQMTTKIWHANKAPVVSTVFFEEDKLAFAIENDITLAIDDSPMTVSKLSEAGISVIMPVWDYNKHMVGRPNVIPFQIL